MVFCAYCGKSFTRKEHLERHIPSHTNVKPHRCSACQLSFARRDLLQRHHATYHEARDPVAPLAGGGPGGPGGPGGGPGCGAVPSVAGRTPIACQNCANAKTGCDKRVPCARCAEKNLPCAARFARRSSKAAVRGGSGGGGVAVGNAGMVGTGGPAPRTAVTVPLTPTYADLAQCPLPPPAYYHHHQHTASSASLSFADACGLPPPLPPHDPAGMVGSAPYDMYLAAADPASGGMDGAWAAAPQHTLDDAFAGFGDRGYADLAWADYPMLAGLAAMDAADLDLVDDDGLHLYANPLHLGLHAALTPPSVSPAGLPAPTAHMAPEPFLGPPPLALPTPREPPAAPEPFLGPPPPPASGVSPHSEPMTASSSSWASASWASSPMHTRGTSILSWSGSGGGSSGASSGGGGGMGCGADGGEYGGYGEAMGLFLPPQALSLLDGAAVAAVGTVETVETVDDVSETDEAAEAAWPLARCMPVVVSGARTRPAREAVERLQQQLQRPGTTDVVDMSETADPDDRPVVPLTPDAHEALRAVLDSAVHRALVVHGGPGRPCCDNADADHAQPGTLPSPVLDALVRGCVRSLVRHAYDPLPTANPNALLLDDGAGGGAATRALVLLMLARGAAATADAPLLAAGLAEVGRVALADCVEADGARRADATVLCGGLLSAQTGAWSGEAGPMDAALGQRSTGLRMLQHAGLLEPQPTMVQPMNMDADTDRQWHAWRQREAQNRLVYGWVFLDQELSLFYDTAPALGVDGLQCPLPSADALWHAPSASRWRAVVEEDEDNACRPPSLYSLFRAFLRDPESLARRRLALSPQQLRLLLYPLQSLVSQLGQRLSCCVEGENDEVDEAAAPALSPASTLHQLSEAKTLLHRWLALAAALPSDDDDISAARVLFHLVALNADADVPAIERLARTGGWPREAQHRRRLFRAPRRAVVDHCGQVLRLLRQMPAEARPGWWSVAFYRAVLVLWADSVLGEDNDDTEDREESNAIGQDGIPDTPADILRYGAEQLGAGPRTRLGDGIRRKLQALRRRWEADGRDDTREGSSMER